MIDTISNAAKIGSLDEEIRTKWTISNFKFK
jgi:hypothetical protein